MKRSVPLWFVMMPFLVVGSVPAMAHVIARVSVSSTGEPNDDDCLNPWISSDGRYVAFASWASNLVSGDTNGTCDVFVHDCTTGQTTRVSVSSAGGEGNDLSGYFGPVELSSDGRFVLFDSDATNLAPGPLNPDGDLYVHDCLTGETTLVPRPPDQGYGLAIPAGGVSGDGRYVWRFDKVMEGGALTAYWVASIYDRQMDSLTEAFRGDGSMEGLSVSADGSLCAYERCNVPGDGGKVQVYVYDRLTCQQEVVSVSSSGTVGNGGSQEPAMSADGRWVAFVSNATNLVPDDTNSHDDVFVRDRQTGQTERVSVSSSEEQGNADSGTWAPSVSISADGRFVAFLSQATNLVVGDTNGLRDVFVRDRQAGETSRVDVDASGNEANGFARGPSISADGQFVVFPSTATNLVPIPPLNEGEWGLDVFLARNANAGSAPSQPTVDVTPDVPETDDDLACTITQSSVDPNGDPITYRYRWYKAEVHQADYDDLTTVPASATAKSETWKCVVTPNDGTEDGPSGEDSATVANSAPTQPAVDVAPDAPKPNDDLTCTVTEDSTDADDDTVTYQYRWYKDDVHQSDCDDQTTVPASATSIGEVWKCVVTPTDATDDGPSDEDQVTVDGPSLTWAGAAGYESDGVDPDIGYGSGADSPTTFTFKVKYTDPSGNPPLVSKCVIQLRAEDGGWAACKTPAMTLESGSIATGAIYSCAIPLPNETLKYRFQFIAADGTPADGPPAVYGDGPFIIGRPKVCWTCRAGFEKDGVDPESGPLGTNFKFQVKYSDSEGDAPTICDLVLRRNGHIFRQKAMSPAPTGDLRLGQIYRTSVTITKPGAYEYRFHFADASGNALGPPNNWTSGPTITDGSSGAAVTSLAAVPTRGGAQITFSLSSAANVTATVVNVAGRPIRTIVADKPLAAGLQTLLWDRRAESGLAVPSGLYLIRVTARADDGGQSTALTTVSLR